ncbi:IS5/IS1182 family transposase [Ralstonia solanacearum K60]|uniref:IS5/IS1182 family transposase n=3 Tax=Ralstonia TaxID=48736 RepID=A0AAP7ZLF7_RALSL|nr:IS5 family transposase [Ralstonia solanacearum]OYQ09319.1 IS5/IS1182 family transposase [Ralstonia solanacearum K60]OYQ09321.1 IS5/IS1182 family transposase [Ralstonia solanacearum K60]OYQ12524.1 IS5/IS1182 family transposase [Ralstonia solanacearum K60]CCF97888.1 transposase [Ralstonia solanacearum K60]
MMAMIAPRTDSSFFARQPDVDLLVEEQRISKLQSYVATLARMAELVDFLAIAASVDATCPRPDRSRGGRRPYPTEIMVRMVFLQALYNLSDEECEHQVLDRRSFQCFCMLDGVLHIPDARTLWAFKHRLAQGGLGARAIFDAVSQQLQQHGYIARGGQIVDASIVTAPTTRIKDEERQAINQGNTPEGWSAKRMAHTDQDARWTKKHGKSFYGYKLHANVDARYKLVRRLKISAANIDDGQTLADVLDPSNTCSRVLADRGYDSGANRDLLEEHHLKDRIARRTQAGKAPGTRLKARNRAINRTRARVEHVFAGLHQLGGKTVRALTLARNTLAITLKCVAYNVKRLVWLAAHDPA